MDNIIIEIKIVVNLSCHQSNKPIRDQTKSQLGPKCAKRQNSRSCHATCRADGNGPYGFGGSPGPPCIEKRKQTGNIERKSCVMEPIQEIYTNSSDQHNGPFLGYRPGTGCLSGAIPNIYARRRKHAFEMTIPTSQRRFCLKDPLPPAIEHRELQ